MLTIGQLPTVAPFENCVVERQVSPTFGMIKSAILRSTTALHSPCSSLQSLIGILPNSLLEYWAANAIFDGHRHMHMRRRTKQTIEIAALFRDHLRYTRTTS